MSKYSTLKAEIIASIKRNGAQAITGDLLQEKLLAMIDSLGEHYQFGGLAIPSTEFTPGDEPVAFIAATPGTYTNFGGLVVADGEVALLVWDGSTWSKQTTDIATRTEVSQLGQEIDQKILGITISSATSGYSDKKEMSIVSGKQYIIDNIGSVNISAVRLFNSSLEQVEQIIVTIVAGNTGIITPSHNAAYISVLFNTTNGVCNIYDPACLSLLVSKNTESITLLGNKITEVDSVYDFINFGSNLFDTTQAEDGKGYNATSNTVISNNTLGIIHISVKENTILKLRHSSNLSPYGYKFYTASGSSVSGGKGAVTGDMDLNVPATAADLLLTYFVSEKSSVSVTEAEKTQVIKQEVLDELNKDIEQITTDKSIKIKDFNDSLVVSGNRYNAFFSGINFNGKEVHCSRDAIGHMSLSGNDSCLTITTIDPAGNRTFSTLEELNEYVSESNGEFRGPHLGKTRDGNNLLMLASVQEKGGGTIVTSLGSFLFIFDRSMSLAKAVPVEYGTPIATRFKTMFGRPIQTPSGHILICGYDADGLYIFRSAEKITETFELTFSLVYTFSGYSGANTNEACLGYVKNKLVIISRADPGYGWYAETSDLEGGTGWSEEYSLGIILHSPELLLYQNRDIICFAGSTPISQSVRCPCIVWYNTSTHETMRVSVIDNALTGWGGYPSFIEIEDGVYAMMYYDDYQNARTAVYYQRVNSRYKCDLNYFL